MASAMRSGESTMTKAAASRKSATRLMSMRYWFSGVVEKVRRGISRRRSNDIREMMCGKKFRETCLHSLLFTEQESVFQDVQFIPVNGKNDFVNHATTKQFRKLIQGKNRVAMAQPGLIDGRLRAAA